MRGRDDPKGLTAREVLENIANFPLRKEMERDERGEIVNGANSYSEGYAAWRNQEFAKEWLRLHPARRPTCK